MIAVDHFSIDFQVRNSYLVRYRVRNNSNLFIKNRLVDHFSVDFQVRTRTDHFSVTVDFQVRNSKLSLCYTTCILSYTCIQQAMY